MYPLSHLKMMLRNKKVIDRPLSNFAPNHMSRFISAFAVCVFCNLLIASSPGFQHPALVIRSNNLNATTDLALKPVPKPALYVFSSNITFSNRIKNAWPFLERQYMLTDANLNRTVSNSDFARKVALVANNGKNIIVSIREFVSGLELQTVAFYSRPVMDFVEINLLW